MESITKQVPPGGPSTINGVLYQMLWTLLQATQVHVRQYEQSADGPPESAILMIEPPDGGDLKVALSSKIVVQQIKARTSGNPWSVREMIEKVIPDLYLAYDNTGARTAFQFVTEGSQGDWANVSDFFRSLAVRKRQGGQILSCLDDKEPVTFRRKHAKSDAFWPAKITERSLFEKIASVITDARSRRKMAAEEPKTTHSKLWHVLGNLEFLWRQTEGDLCERVDSFLLDVADRDTDVEQTRLAMLADLQLRSTSGNAPIVPRVFLRDHGVDTIPISAEEEIRKRSHGVLQETLRLRKYKQAEDVRLESARDFIANWPDHCPLVAVVGECGMGKSWQLSSMAISLESAIPIYLECRENADATLEAAAQAYWHIKGNDTGPPLERVAARRRRLIPSSTEPWLFLFIDDVHEIETARQLVRQPWERWKIRAIFGCHPSIGRTIKAEAGDRCRVEEVGFFSMKQAQEYVSRKLGDNWTSVPVDVLSILRVPLLAQLFCESVVVECPEPKNEYELFDQFWQRLLLTPFTFDAVLLEQLVGQFLNGNEYPWTAKQLRDADVHEEALKRIDRSGWLRAVSGNRYEMANDRLLNWAVAVVLAQDLQRNVEKVAAVGNRVGNLYRHAERPAGRYLGYVAMDLVWLLLKESESSECLNELIAQLEQSIRYDDLYKHLLPTIGTQIAPILLQRMRDKEGNDFATRSIEQGLGKLGACLTPEISLLLDDSNKLLRRCAARLAKECPDAELLDQLWRQHAEIIADPDPWESGPNDCLSFIERESMDALRACSALKPDWIDQKLKSIPAESTQPVHDLVWLVSSLSPEWGRRIWNSLKRQAIDFVSPENDRCLLWCMYLFPDTDDLDWLTSRLSISGDYVAATALYALVRVDAQWAIAKLQLVDYRDLYMTRDQAFSSLLAMHPEATRSQLLNLMKQCESPWERSSVWFGYELWIDRDTLLHLLFHFRERLSENLTEGADSHALFRDLQLLEGCVTAEHIACFRSFAGSGLEDLLVDFIRRDGPRPGVGPDSLVRKPATVLLSRIGGTGITSIINDHLVADSVHAKLDGAKFAAHRVNKGTLRLLAGIVTTEWSDDKAWIPQTEAAQSLVFAEEWEPLVTYFCDKWPTVDDRVTTLVEAVAPIPESSLHSVRETVKRDADSCSLGLVRFLGYSGNAQDIEVVRDILRSAEAGSHLASACVMSLRLLGDTSQESVPLLKRELNTRNDNETRFTLIRNKTDEAIAVLLDRLRSGFEVDTAANLINHERTRKQAIQVTKERLENTDDFSDYLSDVRMLIEWIPDKAIVRELLTALNVQDTFIWNAFAPQSPLRVVGARAATIEAVAIFDPERAWKSAVRVFRDSENHDRFQMPRTLTQMNADRAQVLLLSEMKSTSCKALQASICRALSSVLSVGSIRDLLRGSNEDKVIGCRVTGWAPTHVELYHDLRRAICDDHEPTSAAAVLAIHRVKQVEESEKLVAAIANCIDFESRWSYLYALIQLADPGNIESSRPEWVDRIWEQLHPYQRQKLNEKLPKRQKEKHDALLKSES